MPFSLIVGRPRKSYPFRRAISLPIPYTPPVSSVGFAVGSSHAGHGTEPLEYSIDVS
jgi:hypothetical protein